MPSYLKMSEIIVKDKQEKKNIGGHKPFGVDLDPNKDLCLVEDKEKGQKAVYKGQPMRYMDYWDEICTRGEDNKKGKLIGLKSFSGFGKGTLKKPYKEISSSGR